MNASLSNDILQAATSVVTVAGAFVGMALASPVMLCVLLVTVPVAVVITVVRSSTVRPSRRRSSRCDGRFQTENRIPGLSFILFKKKGRFFVRRDA